MQLFFILLASCVCHTSINQLVYDNLQAHVCNLQWLPSTPEPAVHCPQSIVISNRSIDIKLFNQSGHSAYLSVGVIAYFFVFFCSDIMIKNIH